MNDRRALEDDLLNVDTYWLICYLNSRSTKVDYLHIEHNLSQNKRHLDFLKLLLCKYRFLF